MDKKANFNYNNNKRNIEYKQKNEKNMQTSGHNFRQEELAEKKQQEELHTINSEIERLNQELINKDKTFIFQSTEEETFVEGTTLPKKVGVYLPKNNSNGNFPSSENSQTKREENRDIHHKDFLKNSSLPFYASTIKSKIPPTERRPSLPNADAVTASNYMVQPKTQNNRSILGENQQVAKTQNNKKSFENLAFNFQKKYQSSVNFSNQNKNNDIEFIEKPKEKPIEQGLSQTMNVDFSKIVEQSNDNTICENLSSRDDATIKETLESLCTSSLPPTGQNLAPTVTYKAGEKPQKSRRDPMNLIGTIIIDKYNVIDLLGRGGMGVVYLAEHKNLGKKRAIKILPKSASIPQEDIDRFYVEANIAASIENTNVVQVHDIDETEDFYFIVMEYVEGNSLDEYMKKHGIFSIEEAVEITKMCAKGLAAIHQKGLVHRDVKPANFMYCGEDVKITDFGIAKDLNNNAGLTAASTIIGTPQFMAPEMAEKEAVDPRSDIYSLGATLYFLVTGQFCFTGTPMQIMYQVINVPVVDPQEYNDSVPLELSQIILKMLAKNKSERFSDMEEVLTALDNL
ncbi:serine/threonine-protein kinase [Candidatus Uabimicrobium sp. HlEnr_7]|uniref:serine/threonine-protein kinase n=1 Tax=Candidatus Uabimicrobium helgolandensis TaxID=3095367 RepID=UPI0035578ECA